MVDFKVKNNARAGNTVTLQVEVEPAAVHSEREHVVENASRRVSIPGFRKGKAPKDLILKQLDPGAILEQTLENLAKKLYPEVVQQTAIRPVDSPQLEVEEVKDGGPVKLKFSVTVYPEVKLGK
jgi:trigger factor